MSDRLENTRMGRLVIALGCVAIVFACTGIERLLDRPWVFPVDLVHGCAALLALGFMIGAVLGPRIMPMDDDWLDWDDVG